MVIEFSGNCTMTSSANEEAIINLVKQKRFLWDSKDADYKNITLKTNEFEQIGSNFNLTGKWTMRGECNVAIENGSQLVCYSHR